jgi:uncharacterized protein (TIGR03435 family)
MRHFIWTMAFLFVAACPLHAGLPAIGSPAPEISLDRLFPEQPVVNASLKALAGKAVVLEFWGIWCSGCVNNIAHLNQLAEEFRDRPIVFLSAIEDEAPVVEEFLKKRPIRGWVGIAQKARLFQNYGVEDVPRTVLIDSGGRIAAVTRPEAVNSQALTDLLANRPVNVPREASSPILVDIAVQPASDAEIPGRRKYFTGTLAQILMLVTHIPENRIEGEATKEPRKYDFYCSAPSVKWDEVRPIAEQLVSAAFHLKFRRERRETDVFVVSAPGGKPLELAEAAPAPGVMFSNRNSITLPGATISSVAEVIERRLQRPVIDETGLTGWYRIRLSFQRDKPELLLDSVRQDLGLTIQPERRPIEFLTVNRVQ